MTDSILYRMMKSPTMVEEKRLVIVPLSLQQRFLVEAHDSCKLPTGLAWPRRYVGHYCSHCKTCQATKAHPATSRATSLQIFARPSELPNLKPHHIIQMETAGDWEEHLQLLLFAHRTTKHSSTGLRIIASCKFEC